MPKFVIWSLSHSQPLFANSTLLQILNAWKTIRLNIKFTTCILCNRLVEWVSRQKLSWMAFDLEQTLWLALAARVSDRTFFCNEPTERSGSIPEKHSTAAWHLCSMLILLIQFVSQMADLPNIVFLWLLNYFAIVPPNSMHVAHLWGKQYVFVALLEVW